MSIRNGSAATGPLVSRSAARAALAKALRLYVGRGRRYSVKELSNGTGVPDRLIECAMAGSEDADSRNTPIEVVLTLSLFLGAEFSSEWMLLAGQGVFDLPDDGDPSPGEIAAEDADDHAVIARAARDGKFDADERTVLRPVGLRMVSRGQRLAGLSA